VTRTKTTDKDILLAPGLGTLTLSVNHPFPKEYEGCFENDIQDHRILSTAIWYKNQYPDRTVCLVTKDVNLRMKAKALGMFTQDYLTDHIKEERFTQDYERVTILKDVPAAIVDKLNTNPNGVTPAELKQDNPVFNQLFKIITGGIQGRDDQQNGEDRNPIRKNIVLARYNPDTMTIVKVNSLTEYGIAPRNEEQVFAMDAVMNPSS
jgi:PhoH-like ATPase